jgi:hypothetical protein
LCALDLLDPADDLVSCEKKLGEEILLTHELSLLLELLVIDEPTKESYDIESSKKSKKFIRNYQ